MKFYSVNEALDLKDSLNGRRIYIEGLLCYGTENISLLHWPKFEQKGQSIWIQEGNGVFRYNPEGLEKLSGKKVVCLGEFESVISEATVDWYWGFGHLGCWPAQIVATELMYYKTWHDANGTLKT